MEEDYKRLIEEIRDGYFLIQDGKMVLASNYIIDFSGYSRDEVIGMPFAELIAPEERERIFEFYTKRVAGQEAPQRYETLLLTKEGTRVPSEITAWLTHFQGQPATAGIAMDITERKTLMEKLQDSEERYRSIVENSPDIIYTADTEGTILSINKASKEIVGYGPEELIGRNFMDFIPQAAMPQVMEDHNQLVGGDTVTSETLTIRKDGVERHLEFSSVPFVKDGAVVMAQGIIRDITDRKRAEEKLNRMFKSMTDGVTVTDLEGVIIELNQRTAELHGYDSEDKLLGKNAFELIAQCDHERALENMQKTMELGLVRDIEYRLLRENGSEFYGELSASVLKDAFGRPEGFIGITRDVTEKKRAEETLRESSEMLHLIFKCAPYGIAVMDINAVIVDANDQTLKLCGCSSKKELVGRSALEFIAQKYRNKAMKDLNQCLNEGTIIGFEYTILKDDASITSAQVSAGVLRGINDKPIGFIGIARDITEEKQLRENKQFYITEIIKASENGKRSLARALHDSTIQELLLATHRLHDVISGNYGRLPKLAQKHLQELRIHIENTMAEIRGFTTDLRPDVLDDMGLIPALHWLANRLREGDGIDAGLSVIGKEKQLPSETELTLFRIAQEAVSNIRKHACASTARVTLKFGEEKIDMSISDNGKGFELPKMISQYTREHKLGLAGIAERIHLLDGRYKIESSPGKGTVVRVEIDG